MKPKPRYIRSGRRGPDELVRPIAPVVLRLAAETEEAKRHENLAVRYGAARTKRVALDAKLEEAKRLDLAEERAAAETGRRPKLGKAKKVEEEVEAGTREVDVLAELIEESALELLAVVADDEFLTPVREETDAALETALVAVHDALLAARSRYEEAVTLAAERAWIVQLAERGEVPPFGSMARVVVLAKTADRIRAAIAAYEEDRHDATEREQQAARERDHAATLKDPRAFWETGATVHVAREEIER
jgi:hypothetical protein